ncbi:MAG TPA: transglutaminase family protein, partial [Polyangia bacterium]|nr:transglutaminase family protein [Polyangia bacterium]
MQIRLGYELDYELPQPTPMILTLNVHHSRISDVVRPDRMKTTPSVPTAAYRDKFGNWCTRLVAPAGRFRVTSDATINDSGEAEPVVPSAIQLPVQQLPEETLLFLLGSRYCETDKMSQIAWDRFSNTQPGWARVQAICDFVHQHITFGYQFASPTKT